MEKLISYNSTNNLSWLTVKKKIFPLLALLLALFLIANVYAVNDNGYPYVTLETQPPADASDCQASIDTNDVGWISNGYVKVSFNTTTVLRSITFYRGTTKILMLDLTKSYLNVSEEQETPEQWGIAFYKLQWYNHTDGGWDTWDADTEDIDEYFAYRQQIIIRVLWQGDPDTYILAGIFTITRGMPSVQVEWQITNEFGGQRFIEFVPCGVFYVPSDRAILSSDLSTWNERTGIAYGNSFAEDTWFAVGFTAVDTDADTDIQLLSGVQETLTPTTYRGVIGHSTDANWTQSFATSPYEYNHTFILSNTKTPTIWCTAELWTPQDVESVAFYYSTDNGVTWDFGISYNFTKGAGVATGFQTMDETNVNATIYEVGYASSTVDPLISTPNAAPSSYTCSDFLGVYDRIALGVEIKDDASAAYVKAQVRFTGTARFCLEYDDVREPFDVEPMQDYNLVNQTDGRLYFVTANSASSPAWAIGMNQTLSKLRITNYANKSLENVMFSWLQTLNDNEIGAFTTNVHGFLSVSTTDAPGVPPKIFEFGSDNPRFQIHEALVTATFQLQTYLSGTRRIYVLSWIQTLTDTDWDSTGNYTIAMVEYTRATNGWMPTLTPNWIYRRSSSPIVDIFDSYGQDNIEFYLTAAGGIIEGVTPPAATPPPPTPPSLTMIPTTTTETLVLAAYIIIIIAMAAVTLYWYKRK